MDNGASSYRRFLEGDEKALNEIVEMYGDNLMFFINGFVNNITLAEDIMEDTFMELIVHKHLFRGESSFKTYLFKIGRNKALNALKKNKVLVCFDKDIEDEARLEDLIIKNDKAKHIREAMKKINGVYAQVIHLLYFESMSYEEIGKVLKKNNKQVKNLAYRARNSLKEVLEKEGFSYEE
ncbi:MAG: RNA polymerase sigma factor [Clostridia bacterium]|nr:RNA polymerase sigma factor [Clostridia bacterium]